MGYVWEDEFVALVKTSRKVAIMLLVTIGVATILLSFQAISNKAELQSQINRLTAELSRESFTRSTGFQFHALNFEEIVKNSNRVNDRLESFGNRIASLANDLDQQCTIHSDDYYRTCAKLDALQEDNLRQEECIKGLFHNFDVTWEWFALDSKRLDGLASMVDSCHTHPCPILIQRKMIRHRR